jgi:hypothetical protein
MSKQIENSPIKWLLIMTSCMTHVTASSGGGGRAPAHDHVVTLEHFFQKDYVIIT